MTISIIIPAHNEQDRIAATIASLANLPELLEIIVVDDGSTDATAEKATAERAAAPKVKLIRNPQNIGKGGSMEKGLRAASGEIVVFLDADLGATSAEAAKLAAPVQQGRCDMAVADFAGGTSRKGGFGIVMGAARRGLKWKTGRDFGSPISGQRAMRRDTALALCPISSGFGAEVGLTIRAHKKGFSILEVPVTMTHKSTGKTPAGFAHRGKQLYHILKVLLTEPGNQ